VDVDECLRTSSEAERDEVKKRGCLRRFGFLFLSLSLLFLLTQAPFILRRYQLASLRDSIEALKPQRAANPDEDYRDYKGVIHVHSMLGGHSTGNLEDIFKAARANELDFVVMTEHSERFTNTSEATIRGTHDGTLFVGGNELSNGHGDRLLVIPGTNDSTGTTSTAEYIERQKASGKLVFIAYPHEFQSWSAGGYDGLEIYNIYTNAKHINAPLMFFDGLWSYGSYADLLFARFYERPAENLKRWDKLTSSNDTRRINAIAGNDAHANIGVALRTDSGDQVFGFQLDPYERMFRILRNHVVLEKNQPLTQDSLLEALRAGHSYFSFDLFSDATGFLFTAEDTDEKRIMGDELKLDGEVRLKVYTPLRSHIKLFRNGEVARQAHATAAHEFVVRERGVYRVEIYLPQLEMIKDKPWIVSNPIYVR